MWHRSAMLWVALAPSLVLGGCKASGQATAAPTDNPENQSAQTQAQAANEQAAAQGSQTQPQASESILFRGARVLTATGVIYDRGDVLVTDGSIEAVGVNLTAPQGATVIDAQGKTITPGIIDTHSHMGVYASPGIRAHSDGNEAVRPVTAYARAKDGYWPQDPQIDRARAGGVTTAQILPGSANLIGGRSYTVKLYPDIRSSKEAHFPGAPDGLKVACGENPKRVYGNSGGPSTRMGNVAGYRKAFQSAVEYKRRWDGYNEKLAAWEKKQKEATQTPPPPTSDTTEAQDKSSDTPPDAPGRDYGLETLAEVLEGKILVHNHCYRADEMLTMLDLADSFGFKIRSFHHAVEAYKIADRLAESGTSASVWADWWGFKAEAYDGVKANAAILSAAGARTIIHSDSAIGIQRLNQEAAKAMHSGHQGGIEINEDEAIRWITSNAAWALGIENQTGTLEPGKMADIVVWNGNPFSVYTKAEKVYIEGELVYDLNNPAYQPSTDFEVGLDPRRLDALTPAPAAQ